MADAKQIELQSALAAALGNPNYAPTFRNPDSGMPNHQANLFDVMARMLGLPNRAWRGSQLTTSYLALCARNASRKTMATNDAGRRS